MSFAKRRQTQGPQSNTVALSGSLNSAKLDTVIGRDAVIRGTLESAGILRVDGRVEGKILLSGDLIIGETAIIEAEISAQNISVAGKVKGNVQAQGRLEMLTGSELYGDVNVSDLAVAQGARLVGQVSMADKAPAEDRN